MNSTTVTAPCTWRCSIQNTSVPTTRKDDGNRTPTQQISTVATGECATHQLVDIARALLENLVGDRYRLLDVGHHS